MTARAVVVNADDFGRSPGVNRGVIRAHEEGVVTSASLMVRWPDAEEAARCGHASRLSVGLHLDLGEWFYGDGEWRARYEVVDPGAGGDEVRAEVDAQLAAFEELMGQPPTHLDSHQHVHRDEPARSALLAAGERLGVPVRDAGSGVAYSGVFHGQDARGYPYPEGITVAALVEAIERLPAGITELACHPAAADDHESTYGAERQTEH